MDQLSRRAFLGTAALTAAATTIGVPHAVARTVASNVATAECDLRNASSKIEYALIFTGRRSKNIIHWPGHAYMLTGECDAEAKVCRFDEKKIFGFYPTPGNDVAALFGFPVPGQVRADLQNDLDQSLVTHRLIVRTAQNGYDAAAQIAKKYQKDKPYELVSANCVTFLHEVLGAVIQATKGADGKLKLPDEATYKTPSAYLTELFKLNGL